MARQSLKADPIGDATTYLREITVALEEEYRRLEEEFDQKREECEALQSRMAQLDAGHDRLQAALGQLEGHLTPGNGQDDAPVTSTAPHEVIMQAVEQGVSELLGATEPPHTNPLSPESAEDLESPPQAA